MCPQESKIKMFDNNRSEKLLYICCIAATLGGLYFSSLYSYLLFHSIIEIFTIAIAFALFTLTWNTRQYLKSSYLRLLGIGYVFIALIDLIHTLAYKGMGVFPAYDSNLPTQLWIAARYLQAATLLVAPFFVEKRIGNRSIVGIFALAVLTLVAIIFSGNFPVCYIEGKGLTAFKIDSEYVISVFLLVSLYLLYQKRKYFNEKVFFFIMVSIGCTILAEISFTAYVSVYSFANLMGHLFKLAAFYLTYQAILVTGFKDPFELIFRDIKQAEESLRKSQDTLEEKVRERTAELRISESRYRSLIDKVQAAIVLHDNQGHIQNSNRLAQDLLGLSAEQLLGKALIDPAWHFQREDGSIMSSAEYPVSLVLSTRQPLRGQIVGISDPGRSGVAWMLVNAEPEYDETGNIAQIIVSFVDITEHKCAEVALQRLNRELRAISNFHQILLRAEDEQTLLNDICHIVCDEAGYRMAWVGYAENDEAKSVRPVAWAGAEDGYLATANITWADTERGHGPSGTAVRSGESACIQDFITDPRSAPWRTSALQRGYHSSIALPLKDENALTFGSLCIYSTEVNAFTMDEVRLLEELAGDLAFGITAIRTRAERKKMEEAFEQRLIALTSPLDSTVDIKFEDLFNIEDIQKIQDAFAAASGVASIITDVEGRPITKPSNFCHLCQNIIRKTEKGLANCYHSDAIVGRMNPNGPIMQPCLSGGLWDGGASIRAGDHHIANWLIGQVWDDSDNPEGLLAYAKEIKANEDDFREALKDVTRMPKEQFAKVCDALFLIAEQLSRLALQNVQQARYITERKRAEQALRESEIKFRAVFESSVDAIGVSKTGVHTFVNPAYLALFGYADNAELSGKSILDLIAPSHREQILENVRRRAGGQSAPAVYETRGLRKDGSEFDMDVHMSTYELNGEIYSVPIIRDITERKQAEQALRESEWRYREIFDNVLDGLYLLEVLEDGRFRTIEVNPALERMTGIPRAFSVGKTQEETVPAEVAAIVNAKYRHCVEACRPIEEEAVLELPTGHRHFHSSIIPARDETGKIHRLIGISRDITEQKQAEIALRESEERFRRLAENAPDAIYRMSLPDGRYEYASPAVLLVSGYSADEWYASPGLIKQAIHPDWREYFEKQWANLISGRMPSSYEYQIIHKSGQVRWLNQRNILVRDDTGNPIAIEGIVTDITERKQAEEEIRRLNEELEQRVIDRTTQFEVANKELEAFAYSVSHDLRAPLRHIDGFLELLQKRNEMKFDDQSLHYMTNISEAAGRMGVLIDDLLSFSRMGRSEISKVQVNLEKLVQDIMQEFKPETEGRNIEWKISPLPVVTGDQAMLRIVLVNLISNALKFTRSRSEVKIEIGTLPGHEREITVFVRDNGVGFDKQYTDKLFGVFQRLHRAEEFEGTGIGLANVRRIINRHGGRTWAESEINHGATFYFSLPQPTNQQGA